MVRTKVIYSLLVISLLLLACKDSKQNVDSSLTTSEEKMFRPNFHFTPKSNWMNDPNGMFYFNGVYHLYFQYFPEGNTWGPMHWGHATSSDMITWEEHAIALYPDENGYIFSGSAVVDSLNVSGFGKNGNIPIVAFYTYHDSKVFENGGIKMESQAIAYSLDQGYTWKKYDNNPVIANPGVKDFRDPKVSWDSIHKQWNLALAVGDKIQFYKSSNLKNWEYLSEFGEGIGAHGGVWECPDLFPIKVENTEEIKWVLLQNINPGGYNGGSGTQYFIGDFDGTEFTLDTKFQKQLKNETALWVDYGKDNYAGVTWSNIPANDGRKLFIGWMSNWEYAQEVPTQQWRSSMTIARELQLKKTPSGYLLTSQPVKEIGKYVKSTIRKDGINISKVEKIICDNETDLTKTIISFTLNTIKNNKITFSLSNKLNDTLQFGIDTFENTYFLDRSNAGIINFSKTFANKISKAPIPFIRDQTEVTIILDKTSIEIFYNYGETVITEIFFVKKPFTTFSVFSEKESMLDNLLLKQLNF